LRTHFAVAALTTCLAWAVWPVAGGSARNLCAAADALVAEGLLDEAEVAYQALVRNHPASAPCAAKGLSSVEDKRKEKAPKTRLFDKTWFTDLWQDITPWVPLTVVALGLVWLLGRALYREPTVRLGEISGSPNDRGSLGAELVASIRDALQRLTHTSGGIGIVGQWGDAVDIPGDVAAAPQEKLLAALVQLVQRLPAVRRMARQFELTGQLQTQDEKLGVTLALARRTGEQSSAVTLRAAAYDPPRTGAAGAEPLVLGAAAAAWLVSELYARRPLGRRAIASLHRHIGRAGLWTYGVSRSPYFARRMLPMLLRTSVQGAPPLGSPTWEAFAAFSAGSRLDLAGRRPDARRLYLSALDRDPRSGVALFNLAQLEFKTARGVDGDDDEKIEAERLVESALTRLGRVKKAIEGQYPVRQLGVQLDPLWYRATYASAGIPLNLDRDFLGSRVVLAELVRVVEGTLLVTRRRRYGELRQFLLEIEPAVLATYAMALVLVNPSRTAGFVRLPTRRDLAVRLSEIDHRAIARYIDTCTIVAGTTAPNLASYYAVAAEAESDPYVRGRYVRRVLQALQDAVDVRGKAVAVQARTDETYKVLRDDPATQAVLDQLCRFGENPLF
jgi:hypothetical protein